MTKRFVAAAATAVLLVSGACTSDSDEPKPGPTPTSAAPETPPEPTYKPPPGGLQEQDFRIRIRDEVSWAWDRSKGCRGGSDAYLAVEAFDAPTDLWLPIGDGPSLPETARPVGKYCVTEMSVTLLYANRYRFGVAIDGDGIADGSEPEQVILADDGKTSDVLVGDPDAIEQEFLIIIRAK